VLGIAMAALFQVCARAQTAQDDSSLMSPVPSGDPRNARFGPPPGSGAGTTGFVSTNTWRRKRKIPVAAAPRAPIVVPPPDATLQPVFRPAPPPARAMTLRNRPAADETAATRPIRRLPEEDAFAPVGIRNGPITYKPALEVMTGYDSNPGRVQNGSGSLTTLVSPELLIASNWSRHEFNADLRGNYAWYHDLPMFNRPTVDLKANGRLDITSQTAANFEGRYIHATDQPGNPNNPSDLAAPPVFDKYGGSAGITQRFNRLEFKLKGDVDRLAYQDAELNDGTTLKLNDRNYNQYGATLRGSYEWLPGVKPFVEVGLDRRVHDLETDYSGVQRDSDGKTVKAGTTFELTRSLTGEASLGYTTRSYKDPTLGNLSGIIGDASLVYAMTPLTTAKLTAASTVDESTLTGVSGILRRDVGFQLDHSFRRWLIGTAKVGYGLDDYQGDGRLDKRYTASVGLTYKMSREMWLKGEFRQEWLKSNVPGQDYTASIVMVGLRFQR
jgi:hypothetical protein